LTLPAALRTARHFPLDKSQPPEKSEEVTFKNPGLSKRKKELDREKWQKEKAERKAQRQREKNERGGPDGEDPDIAGIVPGPQPPLEE
jgi:hypothetical protein